MEQIYKQTVKRLENLGVQFIHEEDYNLVTAVDSSAEYIKAEINCGEIPEGLRYTWIDMAAGYYLRDKKATGHLKMCSVDLSEAPAKSITEGDVSITFASASDGVKTPEARLDELVKSLTNPPESVFARFRRFLW